MAGPHLAPDLADVVVRGRRRAEANGELRIAGSGSDFISPLTPAACRAISEWISTGGYDEAVARLAAHDADLADQ